MFGINFGKKKKEKEERKALNLLDLFNGYLTFNAASSYSREKSLLLSTVYRCVEVISDSIALLPIEPYLIDNKGFKLKYKTHPSYKLLCKEPNPKLTRFTFIKSLITSMLLEGNGFAYIVRDGDGTATALYYIPSQYITIIKPTHLYEPISYSVVGIGTVKSEDMIHILNHTYDGVIGVSTLHYARHTLGLSMDSESHAAGFFKGGANLAGILKSTTNLTTELKKSIKNSWQLAFSPATGTPNGVAVLEGNLDFQPITVNPADAQLLETRLFNVVDICRFFGVSPVKAFDLSKSSYSTVEATNLSFLTETLSPLLEKIELEFERKLYKPIEKDMIDVRFDTTTLLRSDKQSLANYYQTLFNIGVVSPNDIRRELDMPQMEGGDHTFVQCNIQTLDKAVSDDPANTNTIKENINS